MAIPSTKKDVKNFLRLNFFRTADFAAMGLRLSECKQYLREGVEDWEHRLEKMNDGRIALDMLKDY
jgi:hypothetical protein